jgi:hypothetical protein
MSQTNATTRPLRLGRFFTLAEFERTGTGLPNTAPAEAITCMQALVGHVLDPLRLAIGRPLRVNSGFRSLAVNTAVGGSPTSQHKEGKAADVDADGMDAEALARRVVALRLPFDQLIWYTPSRGGHLHISLNVGGKQRGSMLHAYVGGYRRWSP